MDELFRVVTGLRLTCPAINLEQLLALESPSASFEAHIPAEVGLDFWLYSVDGKFVDMGDGELSAPILVQARSPNEAETLAQEGLRDTIAAAMSFSANTGLQAEVEMRPLQ